MKTNILKRLEKVEKELEKTSPKFLVVIKETDGLYHGACGDELTLEQYSAWKGQHAENNRLILVEITQNTPPNTAGEKLFE